MRSKILLLAGMLTGAPLCLLSSTASAQIPPIAERDKNWDTITDVFLGLGAGTVALMPRVYYSSPDSTVGWKARWHVSSLAPTMTLVGITLLVDGPIKNAIKSPRIGCNVDETLARLPDSGCESFGGPSSRAFASWGSTGAGIGIFLVDTIKYSDFHFNVGSFVGNVGLPLISSIMVSVARSQDGSGIAPENTGQVVAGALPGFLVGALLGAGYSLLREPDCGYGNYLICW